MELAGEFVNGVAFEITYSVDANIGLAFAWNYMTTVTNWDDPPAEFQLDGPFTAGSPGTTRIPGQEPLHWHIQKVSAAGMSKTAAAIERAEASVSDAGE